LACLGFLCIFLQIIEFHFLRRKAAARATALQQRFFACGETALLSLPALNGMQ
jgi:hypothetical protein